MTRGRSCIAVGLLCAGLALSLPGAACTSLSSSAAQDQAAAAEQSSFSEIDADIERLRSEVASDRQKVIAFLSAPEVQGDPPLSEDAEFRSLAEHLTQVEQQLAELEERRSKGLASPAPGPAPSPTSDPAK